MRSSSKPSRVNTTGMAVLRQASGIRDGNVTFGYKYRLYGSNVLTKGRIFNVASDIMS